MRRFAIDFVYGSGLQPFCTSPSSYDFSVVRKYFFILKINLC